MASSKRRRCGFSESRPDISGLFLHYDELYFANTLNACTRIEWTSHRKAGFGICEYHHDGSCRIQLSEPRLKGQEAEMKNVLLHHMIHAFLLTTNKDHNDHGMPFAVKVNEINSSGVPDIERPKPGYDVRVLALDDQNWKCMECGLTCRGRQCCTEDPCGRSQCRWHMHSIDCAGNLEQQEFVCVAKSLPKEELVSVANPPPKEVAGNEQETTNGTKRKLEEDVVEAAVEAEPKPPEVEISKELPIENKVDTPEVVPASRGKGPEVEEPSSSSRFKGPNEEANRIKRAEVAADSPKRPKKAKVAASSPKRTKRAEAAAASSPKRTKRADAAVPSSPKRTKRAEAAAASSRGAKKVAPSSSTANRGEKLDPYELAPTIIAWKGYWALEREEDDDKTQLIHKGRERRLAEMAQQKMMQLAEECEKIEVGGGAVALGEPVVDKTKEWQMVVVNKQDDSFMRDGSSPTPMQEAEIEAEVNAENVSQQLVCTNREWAVVDLQSTSCRNKHSADVELGEKRDLVVFDPDCMEMEGPRSGNQKLKCFSRRDRRKAAKIERRAAAAAPPLIVVPALAPYPTTTCPVCNEVFRWDPSNPSDNASFNTHVDNCLSTRSLLA